MSFYAKLCFNNEDLDRVYTIKTISGRTYQLQKHNAELKIDQEDCIIMFTDSDNYRTALNWNHIESVTYEVSQ